MDKKEIIDGNKLIAQFMGAVWKYQEHPYNSYAWYFEANIRPTKHSSSWWDEFLYHEEWNWLMPVIEKINNGLVYLESKEYLTIQSLKINSTIEAVWLAVINFIKWHIENKKA